MKKKPNVIAYIDDVCYVAGAGLLSAGGFAVCTAAGLLILGAALIAYALIIARR